MGTFSYSITISNPSTGSGQAPQSRRPIALDAQVDTGASYLTLPQDLLEPLGMQPTERMTFRLADGRRVEFPVGEVVLQLDGKRRTVLCVFTPRGATPLLGAFALEAFSLAADPVNKRLVPVEGLLLALYAQGGLL